jgi:hypothetical protein
MVEYHLQKEIGINYKVRANKNVQVSKLLALLIVPLPYSESSYYKAEKAELLLRLLSPIV